MVVRPWAPPAHQHRTQRGERRRDRGASIQHLGNEARGREADAFRDLRVSSPRERIRDCADKLERRSDSTAAPSSTFAPLTQSSQAVYSAGSWLTPPADGHEDHPLGVTARAPGRRGRHPMAAPSPSGRARRRRSRTRRARRSSVGAGSQRPTRCTSTGARVASLLRGARSGESELQGVELCRVERAAFHAQAGTPGNNVERARLDLDVADRGDAAREVADHQAPERRGRSRPRQRSVAASVHRRRPRVPGRALEDAMKELEPMMPVTIPMSPRPARAPGLARCAARESRRGSPGSRRADRQAVLGEPDPLELGDEQIATPARGGEVSVVSCRSAPSFRAARRGCLPRR